MILVKKLSSVYEGNFGNQREVIVDRTLLHALNYDEESVRRVGQIYETFHLS